MAGDRSDQGSGQGSDQASGEEALIGRYFRPLACHPGALGLLDDAATLTPPAGYDVVLTADAIVGGVHFFPDDPPDAIAKKALRVNLSDLAAKGARPAGFLLSLALPKTVGDAWLAPFARSLGADADAYDCPLLGGDCVRTPGPVTISITAFGLLPAGAMLRRSGARPDDRVVVTGAIGDAALGLLLRRDPAMAQRWQLDRRQHDHLIKRYLVPQPRNALADALRQHASAALDVSDGLVGDLGKLCAASGVGADIEVARIPLSSPAQRAIGASPALIETALTGGDDYEIVATVPAAALNPLLAEAAAAGVAVTEIGTVRERQSAVRFLDGAGNSLLFKQPAFSHF